MGLQCKGCEGENIQKLSVIYQQGVSHIETTARDSQGRTVTHRGTQVTAAAQEVAPPEKKPAFSLVAMALLAGLAGWYLGLQWAPQFAPTYSLLITAILWLLGAVLALQSYRAFQFNSYEWPERYSYWNSLYKCIRCGRIDVPLRS